jgi:hypothetical protein
MKIYTLAGVPYVPVVTTSGIVLRKAGRRRQVSPGQLGLFDGPSEGDTKVENGITYRLNANSRWEREDKPDKPKEIVPVIKKEDALKTIEGTEKKTTKNLFRSLAAQVGITDEVDTCSCCGKSGLRRTVVFETTQEWQGEGGDQFVFLGTTCATRAKEKAGKKFDDVRLKVNAQGQTRMQREEEKREAKIREDFTSMLVSKGRSLSEAQDIVKHLESMPNGLYRMAMQMKLDAENDRAYRDRANT